MRSAFLVNDQIIAPAWLVQKLGFHHSPTCELTAAETQVLQTCISHGKGTTFFLINKRKKPVFFKFRFCTFSGNPIEHTNPSISL
jgi:hypothetical protein